MDEEIPRIWRKEDNQKFIAEIFHFHHPPINENPTKMFENFSNSIHIFCCWKRSSDSQENENCIFFSCLFRFRFVACCIWKYVEWKMMNYRSGENYYKKKLYGFFMQFPPLRYVNPEIIETAAEYLLLQWHWHIFSSPSLAIFYVVACEEDGEGQMKMRDWWGRKEVNRSIN